MKKILISCFIFSIIIMSGCQSSPHPKIVNNAPFLSNHIKEKSFNPFFFHHVQLEKLTINTDSFSSVAEWLNDETVLYITSNESGSKIETFHFLTGESNLFYESDEQVMSVTANYNNSLFLVRTSSDYSKGRLTVLNREAQVQGSWEFDESYDLVFSWNPFTGSEIIVTSFKEDWTYTSFMLDVNSGNMVKKDLEDPFPQWLSQDKLVYLDWNDETPNLTAPLYSLDRIEYKQTKLLDDVVMFRSSPDFLVTLGDIDEQHKGMYTFYRLPHMERLHFQPVPVLTLYSNYFIPYNDVVNPFFYTFLPHNGGSIEGYTENFQLVAIDMEEGEKKVLKENLENKPIRISPNGLYCLYGYQLEQLIILPTSETVDLVEFS
ncbi:YqgU-like beta propeller domain-containing protein [Sutcliffiella rhizosphaerae]|uniref:YqgU-like 6-bladed beta-propeller domain-containing protein n=1 Tax=Sutcliffiella rhizosphaerae TaxID=2880967 RepID=A0ABN8A2C3_9BACI|nr:hypothetical protein [Sutcliffiella rhizosphaerae]CAG9619295.1 hypothetical protein BACCIP111883_00062 [Sutcliffiella rhizosphaerae]